MGTPISGTCLCVRVANDLILFIQRMNEMEIDISDFKPAQIAFVIDRGIKNVLIAPYLVIEVEKHTVYAAPINNPFDEIRFTKRAVKPLPLGMGI